MNNLYELKKKNVTDFIKEASKDHRERMRSKHREWALNLAWVNGHQNVNFDSKTCRYNTTPKQAWQSSLVSNLMLPIVQGNVSRFIARNMPWTVVPATPDQEDIQISQTGTKLFTHYWNVLNMLKTMIRVLHWQSTCSSGFLKVGWDPDIGEDVQIASQNVEQDTLTQYLEQLGIFEEQPETIDLKQGDLFTDVVSPLV